MKFKGQAPKEVFLSRLQSHVDIARQEVESGASETLGFCCVMVKLDGTKLPQIIGFSGEDAPNSKDEADALLREKAKEMNPDYVVTISEASILKTEYTEEFLKGSASGKWKTIEDHPEAEDIVAFFFETQEGTWAGRGVLTKNGSARTFSQVVFQKQESNGSRFTSLLPK